MTMEDRISKILKVQRQQVNYYLDHINKNDIERILRLILVCKGTLFITGVGKSGIVAKKIASTIVSTGTKAMFFDATDALHGDMGALSKGDILLALSKSGETEELLRLLPFVNKRGVKTIAITSRSPSNLESLCDDFLLLPMEREICPFNLVPTTSAELQMLFGDLITIALLETKKLTLDQYALNHPAGRIGRSLTLTARDLMLTDQNLPTVSPTTKLVDSLVTLSAKQSGCLLITDSNNHLEGIFTDGDLRRSLQDKKEAVLSQTLDSLMTKKPKCVEPSILIKDVLILMETGKRRVAVIPVVEEGKLVGLLRLHDIIQAGLT